MPGLRETTVLVSRAEPEGPGRGSLVLRTGVAAVLSMAAWGVGRDQSRPVREACDATYSVRPAARCDELFSLAHANTNRPLRSYAAISSGTCH